MSMECENEILTLSLHHRFTKNLSVFRRDVNVSLRDIGPQTTTQSSASTVASNDMMV